MACPSPQPVPSELRRWWQSRWFGSAPNVHHRDKSRQLEQVRNAGATIL